MTLPGAGEVTRVSEVPHSTQDSTTQCHPQFKPSTLSASHTPKLIYWGFLVGSGDVEAYCQVFLCFLG